MNLEPSHNGNYVPSNFKSAYVLQPQHSLKSKSKVCFVADNTSQAVSSIKSENRLHTLERERCSANIPVPNGRSRRRAWGSMAHTGGLLCAEQNRSSERMANQASVFLSDIYVMAVSCVYPSLASWQSGLLQHSGGLTAKPSTEKNTLTISRR